MGAVGSAFFWGLPGLVRERAVTALRSKLDIEATVGDVSIRWSVITLRDIHMWIGHDEALRVRAGSIRLRGPLWRLVTAGTDGVTDVEIDGFEGRIGLHHDALGRVIEKLRSRRGGTAGKNASAAKRKLIVRGMSFELSDGDGALATLEGGRVAVAGRDVDAQFERIRVGAEPAMTAVFSDIRFSLERTAQQSRLGKITVADARLLLEDRDAIAALSPPRPEPGTDSDDARDPATDDPTAEPNAAEPVADDDSRSGTLKRLERALRTIRSPLSGSGGAREQSPQADSTGTAVISAWVTDNLDVTLSNASILKRRDGRLRPIIKKLQGRIRGAGSGEFRLQITGSARDGGTLHGDVRLWPDQLRADGRADLESLPLALIAPLLPAVPWYEPEESRVDAELVIGTDRVDRVAVQGRAQVRNAALFSDRVAPAPIRNIEALVEGKGIWYPLKRRMEIEEAVVSTGGAQVTLKGTLESTPEHYLIDLDAALPATPCTGAVRAIPNDLLGELKGFDWNGTLGIGVSLSIDSRAYDDTRLSIRVADRCEFRTVPAIADLRRFRMPFVHYVLEPDGSVLEMEMGPGTAGWTYLEEVSPFMVHAVIAHEDAQFFRHRGFSPGHIRNALVRNLREGRYVVGASTITMQLVKNLFLRREKTLARKVQEVLLTWWVERVMEKRDILELYLNVIEYGPGVYGVRDAARYYFNRTPAALSPAESVYLSMILPNPKRYHAYYERGSMPSSWADRMRRIIKRLGENGRYGPEAAAYGQAELAAFRFYRDGDAVPQRDIPGGAGRLPYMSSFDDAWDWAASAVTDGDAAANVDSVEPDSESENEDGDLDPIPVPP